MVQSVASHVEDGQPLELFDLRGQLCQLVVTERKKPQTGTAANLERAAIK